MPSIKSTTQSFELSGFEPGEKLRLMFDGIELELGAPQEGN